MFIALVVLLFFGIRSLIFLIKNREWNRLFSAFACFSFALFLGLTIFLFIHVGKDRPLLNLVITGNQRQEWIEWKNPGSPLQKKEVVAHEIKLTELNGKEVGSYFVWGDQVAIRARVIRFPAWIQLLGISNFCLVDRITAEYHNVVDYNTSPHQAQAIQTSTWSQLTWKIWESLYFQRSHFNLVKAATLESQAFPLQTPGSYLLTITESGLGALPSTAIMK
jgi:hypothetical protein